MNPSVLKTSNDKAWSLSNCAACFSKKSRFIKEQKESGSLSSLGNKTSLTKVKLLDNILF